MFYFGNIGTGSFPNHHNILKILQELLKKPQPKDTTADDSGTSTEPPRPESRERARHIQRVQALGFRREGYVGCFSE